MQRCQVAVGGDDISKNSSYPREAELLLKKMYPFNSGAALLLTLGGKNDWIFSVLTRQVRRMNSLFLAGRKMKMSF